MSARAPFRAILLFGALGALSACATVSADCERGDVRLTQNFSGAPGSACTRTGPAAFRLAVTPESAHINPSPWYAFDLESGRSSQVTVELAYGEYRHRYRPDIDRGGGAWVALPDTAVRVDADGRVAVLSVSVQPGVSRVAAQEVISNEDRARWRRRFAERNGFDRRTIGLSLDDQPIEALSRAARFPHAPLIVILGGQHPPEVTGVLGLRAFLETLFGPSSADNGLDGFEWLIVPDLNPDGVERGHWRENLGHTDLNRDWGPFSQPETAAVRAEMEARRLQSQTPFLLLDFHSTQRDVLYTPPDDLGLLPHNFALDWIQLLDSIWTSPGVAFERGPGHNADTPTAKTWFAVTFGAPGLTVEFGDETDGNRIAALAEAAATALRTYLESEDASRGVDGISSQSALKEEGEQVFEFHDHP